MRPTFMNISCRIYSIHFSPSSIYLAASQPASQFSLGNEKEMATAFKSSIDKFQAIMCANHRARTPRTHNNHTSAITIFWFGLM